MSTCPLSPPVDCELHRSRLCLFLQQCKNVSVLIQVLHFSSTCVSTSAQLVTQKVIWGGEVAQTMYTHVIKCKNDKRREKNS
jgi:hypothetical protein